MLSSIALYPKLCSVLAGKLHRVIMPLELTNVQFIQLAQYIETLNMYICVYMCCRMFFF